jgi:hypothetical protein
MAGRQIRLEDVRLAVEVDHVGRRVELALLPWILSEVELDALNNLGDLWRCVGACEVLAIVSAEDFLCNIDQVYIDEIFPQNIYYNNLIKSKFPVFGSIPICPEK